MSFHRSFASLALVLAALVAPARAAAQRPAPTASVLLGIEDEDGPAGFQLRGDVELARQQLSPAVTLSWVGTLGYSRFHEEVTSLFAAERVEATTHILRLAPAARFSFGSHPVFRPYVDGAIGLYYASSTVELTDLDFGEQLEISDDEVSVFLRVAGGASFQLTPAFALGVELGFIPYLGDLDATTTSVLAAATFRL
jgi:hypothetical protein